MASFEGVDVENNFLDLNIVARLLIIPTAAATKSCLLFLDNSNPFRVLNDFSVSCGKSLKLKVSISCWSASKSSSRRFFNVFFPKSL